MNCGAELRLDGNEMLSDIREGVVPNSEEDTLVTFATCPDCGLEYEITEETDDTGESRLLATIEMYEGCGE